MLYTPGDTTRHVANLSTLCRRGRLPVDLLSVEKDRSIADLIIPGQQTTIELWEYYLLVLFTTGFDPMKHFAINSETRNSESNGPISVWADTRSAYHELIPRFEIAIFCILKKTTPAYGRANNPIKFTPARWRALGSLPIALAEPIDNHFGHECRIAAQASADLEVILSDLGGPQTGTIRTIFNDLVESAALVFGRSFKLENPMPDFKPTLLTEEDVDLMLGKPEIHRRSGFRKPKWDNTFADRLKFFESFGDNLALNQMKFGRRRPTLDSIRSGTQSSADKVTGRHHDPYLFIHRSDAMTTGLESPPGFVGGVPTLQSALYLGASLGLGP